MHFMFGDFVLSVFFISIWKLHKSLTGSEHFCTLIVKKKPDTSRASLCMRGGFFLEIICRFMHCKVIQNKNDKQYEHKNKQFLIVHGTSLNAKECEQVMTNLNKKLSKYTTCSGYVDVFFLLQN